MLLTDTLKYGSTWVTAVVISAIIDEDFEKSSSYVTNMQKLR